MEIETKIISVEIIKPSSPTPKSLQKHHLSFLDQLVPPVFMPLVYFYSSNTKILNSQNSNHLKNSLSKTLSTFYPLAGRLVGNLYVDCNDAGVPFTEAEANCNLSQAITNPNPKNTLKFAIPQKALGLCLAAQATYFRCGGVAVGISFLHKIGDALSTFMFANAWSAVASGGSTPLPKFDAAAYFPPRGIPGNQPALEMMKEDFTDRIFNFPASKIAALRERYTSGGLRPSRVEALLAYIWTRFVYSTGVGSDPNNTFVVLHVVNLRSRADPPMSEYNFGNLFGYSVVNPAAADSGAEVVRKVREAVSAAVDGGYVGRVKSGDNLKEKLVGIVDNKKVVMFAFSSLCRFPLNEADFGSGKPVWVGLGRSQYSNTGIFMDAKCGGGIEVLITLSKNDMVKFELFVQE